MKYLGNDKTCLNKSGYDLLSMDVDLSGDIKLDCGLSTCSLIPTGFVQLLENLEKVMAFLMIFSRPGKILEKL